MNKKFILFFTFYMVFICFNTKAQDVFFPFKNLIKEKNFEQAEASIIAALASTPEDCALNYAAGDLYSDKSFSRFSPQKAYSYLKTAKNIYDNTKDKSKLLKSGLSATNINKKISIVTEYALSEAEKSGSQSAYQEFLEIYDLAPQSQKNVAKYKNDIFSFQKNYTSDWNYLKKYINENFENKELISIVQDSIYQTAKRKPEIEIIKYCYKTSKTTELRDSCVLMMHKIYEDCGVYNFDEFWKKYPSAGFKELKEKDALVKEIFLSGNKFSLTLQAAPYRVSYNGLLDLIKTRIKDKDYEGALYKINSFNKYFEGDKYFQNLKNVLSTPERKDLNISIAEENSQNEFQSSFIDTTYSFDGSVMIISQKKLSENEISPSKNLFVYFLDEKGNFSAPKEIKALNTAFNETSPSLSPDMQTLYFCSDGYNTLGKRDIFFSKRLDKNSWDKWSEPKNIGKEFNTPDDESFFKLSYDGNQAFFLSNGKLFRYVLRSQEASNISLAIISGKVLDNHKSPVKVNICLENLETHQIIGQVSTDKNGFYTAVLPLGKNYGFFISDNRFFPVSQNLDLSGKTSSVKIEKNIEVIKISELAVRGIPIVLNNLFFNTGDAQLLPTSVSELERVSRFLNTGNFKVEISGHTDNQGNDADNLKLSQERAEAVKKYLVKLGCKPQMLKTVGYGKTRPMDTNETAEGRQKNRRVEIKIL
ncbi:MAG: OmpA family protein [Bacteroidales bacterium]|nr:OmpA family protein [Bacteroidales bacterium]